MQSLPSHLALERAALIVVDVQVGFDDSSWGPRNNPLCDSNIGALVANWEGTGRPIVYVRHDSQDPGSPLHPTSPGNSLKPYLRARPDLVVVKSVNSAFHGEPNLHHWLGREAIDSLVICGITTNHCCETTARLGANLGYGVTFVLDSTHTFDRVGPQGEVLTAQELATATAVNLHGEFARVTETRELL